MINRGQFQRKNFVNEYFFDEIDHRQAWLLGLLASDGNVSDREQISLSQSGEKGKTLLQTIASMIEFTGPIYRYQDSFSIQFGSKHIAEILSTYNIRPRKTLTYSYPELLPDEYMYSFLRGYIDGDGSVGIYSRGTEIQWLLISWVGTPEFVEQCATRLPIKGKIRKITTAKNLSEVRYSGNKAVKLGQLIWSNDSLPHYYKQEVYERFLREFYTKRKYTKYEALKTQAVELLKNNIPAMDVAKTLSVPFQTIYRWKKSAFRDRLAKEPVLEGIEA